MSKQFINNRNSITTPETLSEIYGNPPFIMAYGSGVFNQEGNENKMIDLVFGVEDSENWHRENLQANPSDYSMLLRLLGAQKITHIQRETGAQVLYNVGVPFGENTLKYGVIEIEDLLKDLREWTYLYVAGRLHKPVEIIRATDEIRQAIDENLCHALNLALILLPEKFTIKELLKTITEISYTGDARLEDPDKTEKIVDGSFKKFCELYKPAIRREREYITQINDNELQQDSSPLILARRLTDLPQNLLNQIKYLNPQKPEEVRSQVKKEIANIVRPPSIAQIKKGAISTSPVQAIKYGLRKFLKSLKNQSA